MTYFPTALPPPRRRLLALLCCVLACAPGHAPAQDGAPPPIRSSAQIAYAAGLTIADGRYQPASSLAAGTLAGKVTNVGAAGFALRASGANRNGIVVHGGAQPYLVSDASIDLAGNGSNDFEGIAAGALVDAGGSLVLKSVRITTNGVLSAATSAREGSVLKVYDSTLTAHGAPLPDGYVPKIGPGMMEPPAPLGIKGTARAHLSTSRSRTYFYHSTIVSDGWGALSTDDTGGDVYLEANDCDITARNSGYGAYADFGATVVLNQSRVQAATYGGVIAGAGRIALNGTDGSAGAHAVMIHSVMGDPQEQARLAITGGRLASGQASILVRSANADILIDGARLVPGDGVLVRSIVNTDPYATRVNGQSVPGIHVAIRNADLRGDILHEDGARAMTLSLEHAVLRGTVRNAVVDLGPGGSWTATGDSRASFVASPDMSRLDATAGTTITVQEGGVSGLRPGRYPMRSGGQLVVMEGPYQP